MSSQDTVTNSENIAYATVEGNEEDPIRNMTTNSESAVYEEVTMK